MHSGSVFSSRLHIAHILAAMVVEVENGGSVVLTEHPGLDLSIPELSCALKAKLFQAMGCVPAHDAFIIDYS